MKEETVLIIGASGEIGEAVIHQLNAPNKRFILHYSQNKRRIEQLVNQLNQDQVLMTVQANLSKNEEIHQLIDSIPFHIDAIVFAQGQASHQMLTDLSDSLMDELYHVHVKATALITKAFLPDLIKQRKGNIIVISSIWGELGSSNEVWYSTMKGAQIAFVRSLAKEVGRSGVRVNAVTPGLINTKMNSGLSEVDVEEWIDEVPLNRCGTVEEVAKCVAFLCSDESSYVNGHTLRVNGGIY
ncbi:elongation factor P 5-aminopentanone reductase [Alkalibacillus aidingensis]|uniref:elongation factor P 5-aminopentanone reductase n=1 Tax=Alkalibacillus aidingensis TaxID=2747607 RepID=UPI00166181C9|nr:SDR family oxidoreductase [Alkalibacillus aidingensis]